jgi:hypothetical protein
VEVPVWTMRGKAEPRSRDRVSFDLLALEARLSSAATAEEREATSLEVADAYGEWFAGAYGACARDRKTDAYQSDSSRLSYFAQRKEAICKGPASREVKNRFACSKAPNR